MRPEAYLNTRDPQFNHFDHEEVNPSGGWGDRGAHVLEIAERRDAHERAIRSRDDIEVAIAVEVPDGRGGELKPVEPAQGVGGAGQARSGGYTYPPQAKIKGQQTLGRTVWLGCHCRRSGASGTAGLKAKIGRIDT